MSQRSLLLVAVVAAIYLVITLAPPVSAQGEFFLYLPAAAVAPPAGGGPNPEPSGAILFPCRPPSATTQACLIEDGGEVQVIFSDASSNVLALRWTNNHSKIMIKTNTGWSLINPDGTGQTPMNPNPGEYGNPSISADGTIAIGESPRPDYDLIHIALESGGAADKNLNNSKQTAEVQPALSPDGKQVAFIHKEIDSEGVHNNAGAQLWVMSAAGGAGTALVMTPFNAPGLPGPPETPDWSPDGQIAFTRRAGSDAIENRSIFAVDGSGGTPTQLTPSGRPMVLRLRFSVVKG